nr:E3 ubiquitin-protein ligase RNF4-like [Plodia interpunctella]
MSRDFDTVDLTSSFYQIDYNNYLLSDTIIEINDSFTTNNSVRRRETENSRNRNRRRPRPTTTTVEDSVDAVNDSVIVVNNSDEQRSPAKKGSPGKRRRGAADSANPVEVNDNTEDTPEISPKKTKKSVLECPICWDDMLNKPLASTKCGHVFCKKCLKKSLKTMKRCPKCRQSLNGNKAFHPLYLS